jgi:hypothetical protein
MLDKNDERFISAMSDTDRRATMISRLCLMRKRLVVTSVLIAIGCILDSIGAFANETHGVFSVAIFGCIVLYLVTVDMKIKTLKWCDRVSSIKGLPSSVSEEATK